MWGWDEIERRFLFYYLEFFIFIHVFRFMRQSFFLWQGERVQCYAYINSNPAAPALEAAGNVSPP